MPEMDKRELATLITDNSSSVRETCINALEQLYESSSKHFNMDLGFWNGYKKLNRIVNQVDTEMEENQ
tara:strand:- start:6235 stop:6438 length:204 start_codon:yes stop_codon:yes gene_type:complete